VWPFTGCLSHGIHYAFGRKDPMRRNLVADVDTYRIHLNPGPVLICCDSFSFQEL
jgi:hypothetical protein